MGKRYVPLGRFPFEELSAALNTVPLAKASDLLVNSLALVVLVNARVASVIKGKS